MSGKIEKHEVVVQNGFAIFETDHFSVYTLAEEISLNTEDINNPQTDDKIIMYLLILLISSFGVSKTIIYLKNKD